jgi:pimeloyl-ACP methyl ester carboxylesterase
MKYITLDQHRIAYKTEGKGTPLVLLHGFCEDSFIWDDFKPALIEAGYSVTCIDLPGFGSSDVPAEPSIAWMADAVHAVLAEQMNQRALLIGHSMGGYVALALAHKHPERLLGLGLFHSHPYPDSEEKKEARRRSIEIVQTKGTALYVKQLIPNLFAEKFSKSSTFVVDKLVHRAAGYAPEGIIAALQAMMNRPDQSDVLQRYRNPVLFLIGTEDSAVPYDYSLNQTTLPETASVVMLEEVGHMGMFEARRKTQQAILQFADFCVQLAQTA